jgi:hypothetical protein
MPYNLRYSLFIAQITISVTETTKNPVNRGDEHENYLAN